MKIPFAAKRGVQCGPGLVRMEKLAGIVLGLLHLLAGWSRLGNSPAGDRSIVCSRWECRVASHGVRMGGETVAKEEQEGDVEN